MKVYVAARFSEKQVVRVIYKKLLAKGHVISADWTLHRNAKPYNRHITLARKYAIEDIDGVKNCDVFVLMTSEENGAGVSTELGAAIVSFLLQGKPRIYVVGQFMDKNFCYYHPSVIRKVSIGEVLSEI